MFERINALYYMKICNNFHLEKEESYEVTENGIQAFGDYLFELTNSVNITPEGNFEGCCLARLCQGNMTNFSTGFFLKTENLIYFREKRLKKSGREKLLKSESVIIHGDNCTAAFYPILRVGYATYIEYDQKTNSVGFVSVKEGHSSSELNNTLEYGICYTEK